MSCWRSWRTCDYAEKLRLNAVDINGLRHRRGIVRLAACDLNDYSVPHTHVGRTLVAVATLDEVRTDRGDRAANRLIQSDNRTVRLRPPLDGKSWNEMLLRDRAGEPLQTDDRSLG